MQIPGGPEELTAAWLTAALRAGGHLGEGATVAAFECERIGQGVGFVGQIVRLRLAYAGDGRGAPATVIAKFPSPEPGARELANLYGLYEREVRFYRDVADSVGIGTPRCYLAAMDAEREQYLLLLEDLARYGEIGDQVQGCSVEDAALAIGELARLHGTWWRNPRLERLPWLSAGADLVRTSMTQAYPQAWQPYMQMFGARLPAEIAGVMDGLGRRIMALLDEIEEFSPLTMVHGDYRLDNMFFGRNGAPYRLAVVDWQSPNRGWGAYDVAYFVNGSLSPEQRRASEMELLARYHAILTEMGVSGYEFTQLVDDYRRSLLVNLGIWVVNGATLEMSNQRAVELFERSIDRLSAAIVDLRALELLPA